MEGCFKNFNMLVLLLLLNHFNHVQLSVTLWIAAHQAPLYCLGKSTGVGCPALLNMLVNRHQISLLCQWAFPSNFLELFMNLKRQFSIFFDRPSI